MRRRLAIVSILGVLVVGASIAMMIGVRRTVYERLAERASLEALMCFDREGLDASSCTTGRMSRGTTRHEHEPPHEIPREVWEQLRSTADSNVRPVVHVHEALAVVVVTRATGGWIRWVSVEISTPAEFRWWRYIGFAVIACLILMVAAATHSIGALRRAAGRLGIAVSALGKDLHAPVPDTGLLELEGVSDALRSLAGSLATTRAERDELLRALAERERLAALGRVVAGIAHEVRNPLAAVKLHAELAGDPAFTECQRERDLRIVIGEAERLDRFVSDLLVVASASPRRPSEHDIGALVTRRIEVLAPWAITKYVELRAGGEGGRARVDIEAVTRAFDNLLRNAVEASPDNGIVEIETTPVDGGVEIHVRDQGAGVPLAVAQRMFEPFATTKPAGTGLGLALARSVAIAHGGWVVYNRVGACTQFTLRLGDGR